MVLPYEPQICKRSKKAVLRPAGQVCPSSALFFKFILAILRKKVKFLHAKCTYPGEILPEKFRFLVNLRVVCRILTAAGAFAIILSKSGTEPGVRAEVRFLHAEDIFVQSIFSKDATKGSVSGRNAGSRPLFLCKGGLFHEHQDCFARPPHRAGGIVPCAGLPAAHGHRPCAAGGQHAVPHAFSHSAVRLCAGRPLGTGRGLCGSAAALGAVRHAADVSHRRLHGL